LRCRTDVPTFSQVGSTPTGVPFTSLDTKSNQIQGVMVDIITEIRAASEASILPHHRLRSVRPISASVGVLMSSSQQRLASATATRLAAITDMEANLKAH
jgi:hypothetical protein